MGEWSPFCSLSARRARSIFSPVSFFIYLAFCFVFKLSVGVSGSVPEREHDHLSALCRRGLAPGREHCRPFALCRRVGLGPRLGMCQGGALSRIGNWPLLFPPRARAAASSRHTADIPVVIRGPHRNVLVLAVSLVPRRFVLPFGDGSPPRPV